MLSSPLVTATIFGLLLVSPQEKPPAQPSEAPTQRIDRSRPVPAAALSPLQAEPSNVDFGFLPPNTPGVGKVTLKNTSDKPVKIELVQASCKCTTTTDLNGKEIPPGGEVALEVKLDGAPAMGVRRSSVKVIVEGGFRPLDIPVKGEVSLPVRIVPPYVNAVGGKNLSGRVVVESIDKKPFRILAMHGAQMSVEGADAGAEPRASYIVSYDLTEIAKSLPSHLYLETDAPSAAIVDLKVRSETIDVSRTIDLLDKRAVVGVLQPGVASEAIFTTRNARHQIDKVTTPSPDIAVEFVRVDPAKDGGFTVVVKVTPRAGFTGFLQVPVTLWAGEVSQSGEIIVSVR